MKYTGYEIIQMMMSEKIKNGEKFKVDGNIYEYNAGIKDFEDCDSDIITDDFFLGEILENTFEKVEDEIEEIDISKAETPFEEEIARKVNEIIEKMERGDIK